MRKPFEPLVGLDIREFTGDHTKYVSEDEANAAIAQDKAENEAVISNLETIHENKAMGLRAEREALKVKLGVAIDALTSISSEWSCAGADAERILKEIYKLEKK